MMEEQKTVNPLFEALLSRLKFIDEVSALIT
jgi:hypothetical protein